MPFVQTRHERGSEDCQGGPAQRPLGIVDRGQSFAPRAEQQNAQQSVAENMTAFANVEVPLLEVGVVDAKEKMQQGIEESAGVVGREPRGRFDGDDDQPQNCGDPRF